MREYSNPKLGSLRTGKEATDNVNKYTSLVRVCAIINVFTSSQSSTYNQDIRADHSVYFLYHYHSKESKKSEFHLPPLFRYTPNLCFIPDLISEL